MKAHAIAGLKISNGDADLLNRAGNFVSERNRQLFNPRNAGAIMRVGMADAGGANPN